MDAQIVRERHSEKRHGDRHSQACAQLTDPYIEKLADTYLNENPVLTEEQAACPTCEMLAAYFYTHVSQSLEELDVDAELKAVEVELRELEGKEWGAARLEAD